MARPIIWRVRIVRRIEDWVDVLAHDGPGAEAEAAKLPHVVSVFGKSAIRGDEASVPERPVGVREED